MTEVDLINLSNQPVSFDSGDAIGDINIHTVLGSIAEVPINATIFCTMDHEPGGAAVNTSKFNSEGWEGEYGCTSEINDLYFLV